ncbi:MAG TPA: 3'-5' exonuclease [Clostridia bacterium]|nr:3'-5' exonuclease [Clostridia bacterium]
MKALVFDTETTGLKPGQICQLSYIIDDDGEVQAKNFFFKVVYMEYAAYMIHGFTPGKLEDLSGNHEFKDSIEEINKDFTDADVLVAHNFSFDKMFMKKEFGRCKREFKFSSQYCTMRNLKETCELKRKDGEPKFPKLQELVHFMGVEEKEVLQKTRSLFESKAIAYHDARYDVTATYLSFIRGINRGYINLEVVDGLALK